MSAAIAVDALPGDDRGLRRFGYGVIAVVFGGFGGWAALAPIDSAAVGLGVVAVESYRKTVQHLEGGIVRAVHVKEGDAVAAGQLLIELEGTQFRAELDVLRMQQLALLAQEARLHAERDGRPEIAFPAVEGIDPQDPRARESFASQTTLFEARRKAYRGEASVLRESIVQLEAQVRGLESVATSKRALAASYAEEMKDLRELLAEGFADRQRLREFERNSEQLTGELAEIQSDIAAAQGKIGETRLRMLQVDRDFQSKVATELGEVQARLSDVTERVNGARDRVERTQLHAPVAGQVLQLAVHTVGGVVSPGQPLLHVVPQHESLVVEAQVSPADIDRVQSGLGARLKFTSFARDSAPAVDGHILTVSADRIVDEATPQGYYLARIQIEESEVPRLAGLELKPGMPAEVMINTGSRTFVGYLWAPITNSLTRAFREE